MRLLSTSELSSSILTILPVYGPICVPSLIQHVLNTPSCTPGIEDGVIVTCSGRETNAMKKESFSRQNCLFLVLSLLRTGTKAVDPTRLMLLLMYPASGSKRTRETQNKKVLN